MSGADTGEMEPGPGIQGLYSRLTELLKALEDSGGGTNPLAKAELEEVSRQLKDQEQVLENAWETMKRRQDEVAALLDGSKAVLFYEKFEDSARAIFDSCKKLIGADSGYIALLSKDGSENEVVFLDAGGRSCTVDPSLPMPIRGLRAESYASGAAVFNNDFMNSDWVKFMPTGHVSLDNVMFAPMALGGKIAGLLGLANKPGGFDDNDARMASAFGEFAAIALHNSRLLDSLREHRDQLEQTVTERTTQLVQKNEELRIEIAERGQVQHRLEALSRNLLQMQEDERSRISRELHDDLGQQLTALRLEVELMKKNPQSETGAHQFQVLAQMLENASMELRRIVRGLRPTILDDMGLESAIEALAREFESLGEFEIELAVFRAERDIDPETAICIYRICQEALNNVLKHAEAENVFIGFRQEGSEFVIDIRDDGKGFPRELLTSCGGMGIIGMQERAMLRGGSLSLESEPEKGTAISVRIPLE